MEILSNTKNSRPILYGRDKIELVDAIGPFEN
jgi:hypothetical protein